MIHRIVLSVLILTSVAAQPPQNRMTLATINQLWANPAFETSHILNAIDNAGLIVDFSDENLTSVLEAARKGNRPPAQVAEVLLRLLKDCGNCRDKFWAPMTSNDLILALAKGPSFARDELRARGSSNFPISIFYIDTLKKADATPELLAMVEDRLTIPVPEGFQQVKLEKTADFSSLAAEGKLTLHVVIHNEVTFLFRHNALFAKMNKSDDLMNSGCTFTAFGPATEQGKPALVLISAKGQKAKNKKEPDVVSVPDPSGRPGLQFTIRDPRNGTHPFDLELKWTR